MRVFTPLLATFALCLVACGPDPQPDNAECPQADLETDRLNCGQCGNACIAGQLCSGGTCTSDCTPGDTLACYDADSGTDGVGPCHGGSRTCQPSGTWGQCLGQVCCRRISRFHPIQ